MWKTANASRIPLLGSALAAGLTLGTLICIPFPARAQEPFGEVRRLDIRRAQPYSNTADREQVAAAQEVRHAGAFFIKLHFSQAAIGPSDYITVSDPAGRQVRHYGALDIANISDEDGFWALSVFGDAARVELHAAPGSTGGGFEIDSYGYADPGILSICGAKDLVDMICLNDGLPDPPDDPNRYDLGRSVAAWLVVKPPGTPIDVPTMHICTAFLIGPKGHALSAGHCIAGDQDKATLCSHTEFWFNYEDSQCDPDDDSPNLANVAVYPCEGVLDWQLGPASDWDWSLLKLPGTAADQFGWLDLKKADPDSADQLFIIQHPGARQSPGENLPVKRYAEGPAGGLRGKSRFTHYVDTRGGSSGSPVFSADNKAVVGIHIQGGCDTPPDANKAQRITEIWPTIEAWLHKNAPVSTADLAVVNACVADTLKNCTNHVFRKEPWHLDFTVANLGPNIVGGWTYDIQLTHQATGRYVSAKNKEIGPSLAPGQIETINWISDYGFPDQTEKGEWEAKVIVRLHDNADPDMNPNNNTFQFKFLVENDPQASDLEVAGLCTTDELRKSCTDTLYTNQQWNILFIAGNNGGKPIANWNFSIDLINPAGGVIPHKQHIVMPPLEVGKKEAVNWEGPILSGPDAKGVWAIVVRVDVKDPGNPDARPWNNTDTTYVEFLNKSDLVADIGLTGVCVTPASLSGQGCQAFLDPAAFQIYNEQHGKAMKGIETFEEAVLQQGLKECFSAPIGPLPSQVFPNGLSERNLHIQDNITPGPSPPTVNPSKNDCALYVVGPGFIGANSAKVGEDIFLKGIHASLDLIFNEPNHTGVGFWLSRFPGYPSDGWIVTAYNKGGQVIGVFPVPAPGGPEPFKGFFGIWCEETIGRINIFDLSPIPAPDAIDDIELWTEGFKTCFDKLLTNHPWHIQFGVQNKGDRPLNDWNYNIDLHNQTTGVVTPLKAQVPGPALGAGESMVLNWPSEYLFTPDDKGGWEVIVHAVVKDPLSPETNLANNTVSVKFDVNNEPPTAVLLSMFTARVVGEGLELEWRFAEPDRVARMGLDRGETAIGPWAPVTAELREVDGAMAALDRDVVAGRTYYYRLTATMRDGEVLTFGPLPATAGRSLAGFELARLAPNPTRGETRVEFTVPREAFVRLSVLDVQGRELAVLAEGVHPAGRYQGTWGGRTGRGEVPPGLYFVRYQSPVGTSVARLAMTR